MTIYILLAIGAVWLWVFWPRKCQCKWCQHERGNYYNRF